MLGYSVQGRPITAYSFGDGASVTAIFGAFHGNEAATAIVVGQLRDYLASHPTALAGARVVLMPVVNPDGLAAHTRANAHRVDLNRNFPGSWRPRTATARSRPGPFAGSEPETQAVLKLMHEYRPVKVISIHSPFHTMNWTGEPGRKLADAMRAFNHYPTTDDIGYPTPGSFGYYCGRVLGVAVVTLELPVEPAATSFRINRGALLAAVAFTLPGTLDLTQSLTDLRAQMEAGATAVYSSAETTPPTPVAPDDPISP